MVTKSGFEADLDLDLRGNALSGRWRQGSSKALMMLFLLVASVVACLGAFLAERNGSAALEFQLAAVSKLTYAAFAVSIWIRRPTMQ
ncbi:hypothetical protein [Paraburkholderia tropica]|uniref:hypothetical protein n=1 Tax=Paraburkholderia tropica TaxID=92647 RepID=UPI002AB6CF9F|nr:hypothetical protein [Paraburkholderia tropica]